MGMLDRFRKGGGGFLSNVDGLITKLVIGNDPGFANEGNQLWATVSVRQDGSDEDVTTSLRVASDADQFVIGDDETSITPVDGAGLWGNEPFQAFYASGVENGLDDPDVDDGDPLQFGHLVGARVRFAQVKDDEQLVNMVKWLATPKGKIALKAGKYNAAGQRKAKDGKYYDPKLLKIAQVYSVGNDVEDVDAAPVKGKKAVNGSGKVTGKAPTAAQRSSATTALKKGQKSVDIDDVAEFSAETLVGILEGEKGNKISKTQLNLAVTRKLVKDGRREDVRKWLYEDSNLASLVDAGTITYAKSGRDQVISLA